MASQEKSTALPSFRTFFFRGLGILLPSVLTIYLLVAGYQFLSEKFAEPINHGLRWSIVTAFDWPEVEEQDYEFDPRNFTSSQKLAWQSQLAENRRDLLEKYTDEIDRELVESKRLFFAKHADFDADDLSVEQQKMLDKHMKNDLAGIHIRIVDKYYTEVEISRDRKAWVIETVDAGKKALAIGALERKWDSYEIGGWAYFDLIGFMIAAFIVYLAGRVLGSFLGRRLYQSAEQMLTGLPGFKQVYPYVKQVTEFLFGGDNKDKVKFNKVVAVEYPRKGLWSVGLVTGETMSTIQLGAGKECVTVFIPSSPTPFTGYVITVPVEDTMDLSISIDEALRFTVSGGVIIPDHQKLENTEESASAEITTQAE